MLGLLAVLVLTGLLAAACSSESGGALGGDDLSQCKRPTAANTAPTPNVSMPSKPPTTLEKTDIKEGSGAPATPGSTITFQYVGVACSTGVQFEATWTGSGPLTYKLQYPDLIQGFVDGLNGMKVGGERQLVIPPGSAYGDSPPPGSGLKANETLVVVVDLTAVS